MKLAEFKATLSHPDPPPDISENLRALWYDANGYWNKAHDIVQITSGYDGDWIHAYLHRKEGDLSNASYWYARIGRTRPNKPLEDEWEELAKHLLHI
ncbi:MAG: hypothetical protein MI975_10975 [Cytophagales bacterium]|nr:hypothetical protein [Cytophagales bacterium]